MPRGITIACLLAIVALGGALLHAGRPDRNGTELYHRATEAFGAGDYRSALIHYDDFIGRHPTSPRVAQALYQMGFIYANHVRQPERALSVYHKIADDYPQSPLADEALRHTADLLIDDGDYDGAVMACQEIVDKFGEENVPLAAQAEKRIADALMRSGNGPSAQRQCERILEQYPDQKLIGAETLALQAEIALNLSDPPDLEAAHKAYAALLENYPESHLFEEAQRSLAWLDQEMVAQADGPAQHEAGTKPSGRETAGRVHIPLPTTASASTPFEDSGILECLRVVLAAKGVEVSVPKLAGWSGSAFSFYYAVDDRKGGPDVCGEHPLIVLGRALGFQDCRLLEERTPENAWERAKHYLDRGEPILTPMAAVSPPAWGIITGYDNATDEVFVYTSTAEYQPHKKPQFLSTWATAPCPMPRLRGKQPVSGYPMFVLGQRTKQFSAAVLVQAALERAVATAETHSEGDYRAGLSALHELEADMRRVGTDELTQRDLDDLESWCHRGLNQLVKGRSQAAEFLNTWAMLYSGDARRAVEDAAALYDEEAQTLALLSDAFGAARLDTGAPDTIRPEQVVEAAARLEKTAISRLREAI